MSLESETAKLPIAAALLGHKYRNLERAVEAPSWSLQFFGARHPFGTNFNT